jgi:hypothetical protein
MEENVRKELDTLEQMLFNWKASYLGFATADGGNDFLLEEFQEEISTYISPYVRRLFQCEYINATEAEEFMDQCYNQVEELRLQIQELEGPGPGKSGLWQKVVDNTRKVLQR